MSLPIRHLPVLQNWDCHVCGTCCKEYQVELSAEEKKRIEGQGWDKDKDLGGLEPFKRVGWLWRRRYHLNHRADGSCVFLSDQGRCRVHENFGYDSKPLPCRLFPFVLIPQGDHWSVSVRYACPSAAANKGRPVAKHDPALRQFADELAQRVGLTAQPDGTLLPPPRLQSGQGVAWADLQRFVQALLGVLENRKDRIERRMRKCLVLANLCRQSKFEDVKGERLDEFLKILSETVDAETPQDAAALPQPGWIGRVLFRQALAVYTRKDHGPNRGPDLEGRTRRLMAALRFVRGSGRVPRLHGWMTERTFEQMEQPAGPLSEAAEEALERYYRMKVGTLHFCGAVAFGMSFWEGFEALALTLPAILWTARAFAPLPDVERVEKAMSIVDDHFGFNRVLSTLRQRLSFKILARRGELSRLIAWYSR